MPTDVNGTINIIAEVVGKGQAPSNDANVLAGRTSKETENNRRGFLELAGDAKKIKLVMLGLLANSKIFGTTLQNTARMIGMLVDVLLMPFIPIFMEGMGFFASIVSFVVKVSKGDWSGIWTDLKDWWTTNWDEGGGLVGIIKAVLAGASGVAALTALVAAFVVGPRAGLWVLQNTFLKAITGGYMLGRSFLKNLLGWSKKAATGAPGVISTVAKTVGNALLGASGLVAKLFKKITPVWTKNALMGAWGLLKVATLKLGTVASNLVGGLWKSRLFGVARIGLAAGASWIGSLFAATGIGGALGLIGPVALFALAVVGLMVTGAWVLNALFNKVFGMGIKEAFEEYLMPAIEVETDQGIIITNYGATTSMGTMDLPSPFLIRERPGKGNPNRDDPVVVK
jgi:hypothetical protein